MPRNPKLECASFNGSLILRLGTGQAAAVTESTDRSFDIGCLLHDLSSFLVSMTAPINPTEVIAC